MPHYKLFDPVHKNINKFEIRLDNCSLPAPCSEKLKEQPKSELARLEAKPKSELTEQDILTLGILRAKEGNLKKFSAFASNYVDEKPKICTWTYMTQTEIENLCGISNSNDIRRTIDKKIEFEYPKGINRLLAVELMYSVFQFCKKSNMNIVQTGTIMSLFFLTHHYFLSSFRITTDQTYNYFKEYILLHCFDCPPDSAQIFNYTESKCIVSYFCTIYLRNLPLLKLVALPNFGFSFLYDLPPEPAKDVGKKK